MKRNSKKHEGFTLIEVIISMALIAIISIGVYNAYLLLIRQTKYGQVKQRSTLIGKQIGEKIKSVSENQEFTTSKVGLASIFELTDNMNFTLQNNGSYTSTQHYNEEGNLGSEQDRYKAVIKLVPKVTENGKKISIGEASNAGNSDIDSNNVYIINDTGKAKPVNTKPSISNNIQDDKTIAIEITEDNNNLISKVTGDSNVLNYTFRKDRIQINMDLKYCTGIVTIKVTNETETPLNLCILNNDNAVVENEKGILNEYYRSDGKIGTLYDASIEIFDEKGDKSKPIFETSFVQNIDIQ
ncbi:prepilin-type N-terminal cleavage/methylation domain-containing protein [Clostridium beijerinckii]|uniref:prepilin-type N-terminal cleavage/methylation domain-containing protein n=1 Tax=Clostridium beijerinckii TaxID=1520 RepID=UPI00242D4CB8|nr:prepilin-type N-terminal cleavage/methylation domain-containing protein [Clostridium beijerinckii]MDG5852946.1 prepilin-type N-terminal cleavage/methylation domain-containing protein [Clostridium beijerinckii]